MTEPVLSLRRVGKTHGIGAQRVDALVNVDLDLMPGDLVAVTGRSGSGKTTLLNLSGALDEPTTGEIIIAGESLAQMTKNELARLRRVAVGYVFQQFNLLPSLTAAENISLPLELDGMDPREARSFAEIALVEVEMEGMGDRYPDQLSGGEQQRVAIARGLVGPRSILLADEPTGALDEATSESILRLLRSRCDAGAAALLVTHEPAYAAWADRVVRLKDGRVEGVSVRNRVPETVADLA
ncbi:MAG TPA: ABC transporter ATP-binding protein [Acidimicrobiia bacterium]|nr:ABC transporter ATP-binding protein [Acidimicrobiia bacterium]